MMKEFWLNLPVKDIQRSKDFYSKLGFSFHPRHLNSNDAAGLVLGEKSMLIMLFPEQTFKSFIRNELVDTRQGNEVLLSIDAESKEEVDEMIKRAAEAGGTVYSEPQGQDGMYGAGFSDVDGHRWNILYMDKSKIPIE